MIDVFLVDTGQSGRLAVALRPRGRDWLEDELRGLVRSRFTILVSMLTAEEERELDIVDEARTAVRVGLVFLRVPVLDRETPRLADAIPVIQQLADAVRAGADVAVHCRQGIGRSSL